MFLCNVLSVNLTLYWYIILYYSNNKGSDLMPMPKGNKKTDNVRKYQQQFDKENYKVAACKIPIAKYNQFQAIAAAQNKTVSGLLSAFIDSCLADPGSDPGQPEK